jgi:hypothetical protein
MAGLPIAESAYLSRLIARVARNPLMAETRGPVEELDPELAPASHDFLLQASVVKASFSIKAITLLITLISVSLAIDGRSSTIKQQGAFFSMPVCARGLAMRPGLARLLFESDGGHAATVLV